jgi:CRISPR-associated protein Csm3
MAIKLIGYKIIKGVIRCETGLRIGGAQETIEIGGMDNPIIRNPVNDRPYIPGSSIKGKLRTILEYEIPGKLHPDGKVHEWCGTGNNEDDKNNQRGRYCPICLIFGVTDEEATIGPSRGIFRDAGLTSDSLEKLEELRRKKGLIYAEEKYENVINRIKGKAENLRQMERVPAGTEFEFEIAYRVFDVDGDNGETDNNNFNWLLHSLWLLTQDALGGSGSRGYGKVSFPTITVDGTPAVLKDRYDELVKKET